MDFKTAFDMGQTIYVIVLDSLSKWAITDAVVTGISLSYDPCQGQSVKYQTARFKVDEGRCFGSKEEAIVECYRMNEDGK